MPQLGAVIARVLGRPWGLLRPGGVDSEAVGVSNITTGNTRGNTAHLRKRREVLDPPEDIQPLLQVYLASIFTQI